MDWITNPDIWISLLTLTLLETVLGIDNVIFISILSGKLPKAMHKKAQNWGLIMGMGIRLILLLFISWILKLDSALFTAFGIDISGKDLILIGGGLFLIFQSTREIHGKLEGKEGAGNKSAGSTFASVMAEMLVLNIVFSLDSVITAVGMANEILVMMAAVIISLLIMMFSASSVSGFVERHPTVKMLALSFLILIGFSLITEGLHQHIPKGYIYFAMAFSMAVEILNIKMKKASVKPVELRDQYTKEPNDAK